MQICPNCGEENPPRFRLCGFCGTALTAAPPPQEVRKLVTIIFCDLKGSTSLGEQLDSESLREVMSRYFDAMSAAIIRHGGTIEKFIGDAVMAVFGLPRVHEDDALRAVRAARGMQDALAELNADLQEFYGVTVANRIGVNSGEVVAGDPTAGQRLVTGDPVNVAARLEQAAGSCEVLLGELTYRLVRDEVEVEPVEPLELKGKSERVPAFRLLGVRARAAERGVVSLFVGREREAAALEAALDRAVDGRSCELVLVTGDAGVGKSRLIEELLRSASDRALTLRGRCLSYGDGITFWPLVEAVREAAGILEDDDHAAARGKLDALVGDLEISERVASAVGLSDQQYTLQEIFWAFRKLMEILARERPLLLVLEDLHWAEPTLLDLVDHVVGSAEDAPMLLIGSARHELLEARPSWSDVWRLALEPLGSEETQRIVESLLDGAEIAPEARTRVVEASEGNPLFVEQLLSMMIDEGWLQQHDGAWQVGELPAAWVPPTIHALLSARLDRLDREERAVIDPAAVVGYQFARPAVVELVEDFVRDHVDSRLDALTAKQLVHPDGADAYRFHHILIRDSVYDGLLKRARASLHERFVHWADRVNGDRATEFEEILGYHLEQAYRYLIELAPADEHALEIGRDGARRLAAAGRRAFVRGDMPAASSLLLRATAILPPLDRDRLTLFPDLGEALIQIGEFIQADSLLEDAVATAELAGEPALAANAELVRLLATLLTGDADDWSHEAERAAVDAIALCEEAGDDRGVARAWRLLGWVRGTACAYAEAADSLQRALEHARRAGDVRQERRASTGYALALSYGPKPVEEAIAQCEEVAERIVGDREAEAGICSVLGYLEALRGEFERGRHLSARARALLDELGLRTESAMMTLQASHVEFLAGDAVAAERELRRGYEVFESIGERYYMPSLLGLLGQAVYAQGRAEEADALALRAQELADPKDIEAQAVWRCVRGKVLAARGAHAEAETLFGEAIELLGPTDFLVMKSAALADLAEALRQRGAGADGEMHEALEQARVLAEAKGSAVLVTRLERLLAAVAPTAASY